MNRARSAKPLDLPELDPTTRKLMVAELARDLRGEGLYHLCPRLTARGLVEWPLLLSMALGSRDAGWLTEELLRYGRLTESEIRLGPAGQTIIARVPPSAAMTIAEGEFNRYYARAVCRRALEAGHELVEVYRAKPVQEPRLASRALIGRRISARVILTELRWHGSDVVPPSGVPGGPNSGISVRLPQP